MKLDLYQIDAFAKRTFEGNPAAVVPLQTWLPDSVMQAIAEENNLAETAFFIPQGQTHHIRWFTPASEVKLCGHATLAAAFVLFNELGYSNNPVIFDSLSGPLSVTQTADRLTLDFPALVPTTCKTPTALSKGLGLEPSQCLASMDFIVVLENEAQLASLTPDHQSLMQLDHRGVIATAPSDTFDFVVRFFGPKVGIEEDSVTGSAFTQLIPYWAERLGKTQLVAKQISARGGEVYCELNNDRVLISGHAVKYLHGQIEINNA